MNGLFLKTFIFLFVINSGFVCFSETQKPVALVKAYTGNIVIKYDNNEVKPARYLSILSNTTIILGDDSNITLILKNGDSVFFNIKSSFAIKDNGLVGLDKITENYIKKNLSNIYVDAKNELRGKNIIASRTVFDLPEEMQNEMDDANNISDPLIKSLAKIDLYQKYLSDFRKNDNKKNEDLFISLLNKEINNYENLKK